MQMYFTCQLLTEEAEINTQLHLQDPISQDQVFYIHYFKFIVYVKRSRLAAVYIHIQLYQSPRSCIFSIADL